MQNEFKYKNVLKFQEGLTGKMGKTIAMDRVLQTNYTSKPIYSEFCQMVLQQG